MTDRFTPEQIAQMEAKLDIPTEALEAGVVAEAREVLRAIELWEADWIMADDAWQTGDGLPKLTQELYDRWIALQERRNTLLAKLEGGAKR